MEHCPAADGLLRHLEERDPARRIAMISDARLLHRRLFATGQGQELLRGTAGRFRLPSDPDQGAICVVTQTPGLPWVYDGLAADRVAPAMRQFRDQMRALLTFPPPKPAVPDALAMMLADLVRVHPFADGNGRTARLLLLAAARHLGCPMSPDWTVAPRPHGPGFSFALLAYPKSPKPFLAYMRRFFIAGETDDRRQ